MVERNNIESAFPLTQVQAGFLWYSLARQPDRCLVHVRCTLIGTFNLPLFEQAWKLLVKQQPVLRTSIHWENIKRPVQVVNRNVELSIAYRDWSGEGKEFQSKFTTFLLEDKNKALDLNLAPVGRLTVIKRTDDEYEFIWLCHHLLLDGWSCTLILQQVFEFYERLLNDDDAGTDTAPSFQEYVRWKASLNSEAAMDFWQTRLQAMQYTPLVSSSIGKPSSSDNSKNNRTHSHTLTSSESESFLKSLRQMHISLNTAMQALWGILISSQNGKQDIVFGTTVSGRQGNFAMAERVVGLLINVLPVRITVKPDQNAQQWLQAIQARHAEAEAHAHIEPTQLLSCSGLSGSLFDSLLVVENQPQASSTGSLKILNVHSDIVSSSQVVLIVKPGRQLSIDINSTLSDVSDTWLTNCLEILVRGICQLSSNKDGKVNELHQSMCAEHEDHPALSRSMSATQHADTRIAHTDTAVTNDNHKQIPIEPNPTEHPYPNNKSGALSLQLRTIWQEILSSREFSNNDSFFDLGGTSIDALRMFERIESELSVSLPVTTLFKAASITKLVSVIHDTHTEKAQRIDQEQTPPKSSLVEIQPMSDTQKIPLFIVDTATDTLMYRFLADELGPEQPIYALAAKNRRNQQFDQLAYKLVADINTFLPNGEFLLAGMSGAGILAWHMTQVFEEQNRPVAHLVLFDSFGPEYPQLLPPVQRLMSVSRKMAAKIPQWAYARIKPANQSLRTAVKHQAETDTNTLNQSNRDTMDDSHTENTHLSVQGNTLTRFKGIARAVGLDRGVTEKCINVLCVLMLKMPVYSNNVGFTIFIRGVQLEHKSRFGLQQSTVNNVHQNYDMNAIEQHYSRMYRNLKSIRTPVVFIKASERPSGIIDDKFSGWASLFTSNTQIHIVPGDHLTMMLKEHARHVASILQKLPNRIYRD